VTGDTNTRRVSQEVTVEKVMPDSSSSGSYKAAVDYLSQVDVYARISHERCKGSRFIGLQRINASVPR
jgi:hypothetical protein